MPVAVKDQQGSWLLNSEKPMPLLCKEDVAKSTLKADKLVTCLQEKGSLICTKQSQTIESLLPDEEDLFSGVYDEFGCTATANSEDEDFDLFSSNGGMEIEVNSKLYSSQQEALTMEGLDSDQSSSAYLVSNEHPSRTPLVNNVDNRVEYSKLRALSEEDTSRQNLDQASLEVLSCDSSISYDKRHQVFGNFGEIEEIGGTTHHRRIEFYDIKAVEAAINGLSSSNMLQEIKHEVNYPECAKSLMQQFTHGLMHNQLRSYQNPTSNSLPHVVNGCMKDEYIYGEHSPLQTNSCITNSFSSTVGISSFHPQSLPVNCNGAVTFDSLNLETVSFTPETNSKHLHMLGSYGPPLDHMFGGSSRNVRSALGGHHVLNCSNSFQYHHDHLNPVTWAYSHPFNNNDVCAHTTFSPKKCSFSRSKRRVRRTSHGRHEPDSCQFELDIERVLRGEDTRTTLMIKNIPNKYSSAMLLAAINEHNQGTYDFIYLPLDFKNKCNMGYAFINMTDPLQIVPFHKSFNGKKWEKFHSGKVACLAYARIQGKAALIAHFQESSLLNQDKCCHPILFTTDGPNAGNQEPFPLSPNIQSRRHKNRANKVNADQVDLSTSLTGESYYHIKNNI